jgi:hypothetical protein
MAINPNVDFVSGAILTAAQQVAHENAGDTATGLFVAVWIWIWI